MINLRLGFIFFLIGFLFIFSKLIYLQFFSDFSKEASFYLKTEKITPIRGQIFDIKGNPLAINQKIYDVYLEPDIIKKDQNYLSKYSSLLGLDIATLEAKLNSDKKWIRSGIKFSQDQYNHLHSQKGLQFQSLNQRYYPESSLSAHLIGFVGQNEDGLSTGYFGVEGYFQQDLKGLPGIIKSEEGKLGLPIFSGIRQFISGENGRDLYLTIDNNIQYFAKKRLSEGMMKWGAKSGCIIAVDPNSLSLLALSCLPNFDPNSSKNISQEIFINPAISQVFEPGSIFKPLIMGAGLEEKVITAESIYDETGPIQIGEYSIATWDDNYAGKVSMTKILEKSSNVGMVHEGRLLGNDKLYGYLQKFGLGSKTNIELQGETSGSLKDKSDFHEIDFATATFGQGIAVSPMQMITAFASLINGGNIMTPFVISKIVDQSGNEKYYSPKIVRKIFSEKTSSSIRTMLKSTILHSEAKYDLPKNIEIGGKTGTAQIAVEGKYDAEKTIASFMGFFPVEKPKILILVSFKEPTSSIYGSETAAVTFFELAHDLIGYMGITQ